MIGRLIHNYRVEELLGEGGMGTVYRAADTLLQRPVALKALHPHLMRDTTFFERFRNEAVVSARLNHPNVATLYNFIKDGDDNFMVMEFVDGANLEQLLRTQERFSVENAVRLITQALPGLHHAHRKEILHRDIKPANLMLTREGNVKLMDFGIARLVGSERLTRLNRVMGTLEYIAPEILDGGEPSVQSDLYAVGILLYELLSGKMPFTAMTDSTLIHQILNQKPVSIREHVADMPIALANILEKLLQKKPEKRYDNANDLRLALAAVVPPGPLDWVHFQSPVRAAVKPPKPSAATADKPVVAPSRLVGGAASGERRWPTLAFGGVLLEKIKHLNFEKNTIDWAGLRTKILTLEGLILLGALLLSLGIVGAGVWMKGEVPSEAVALQGGGSAASANVLPLESAEAKSTEDEHSEVPENRTNPVVYETGTPNYPVTKFPPKEARPAEREKSTEPKKSSPKDREPTSREPKEAPAEPKQEAPKKEAPIAAKGDETPARFEEVKLPAPEKTTPARTRSVELRGESFPVAFNETVTSDEVNRSGGTVWLRTLAPVVVDGTTVIEAGARVRGRVADVRSSASGSRAYLAVQFEAVEAVNGQWVSIRFPEYSNKANDRVTFERNRRVNDIRVYRTSLVFKQ